MKRYQRRLVKLYQNPIWGFVQVVLLILTLISAPLTIIVGVIGIIFVSLLQLSKEKSSFTSYQENIYPAPPVFVKRKSLNIYSTHRTYPAQTRKGCKLLLPRISLYIRRTLDKTPWYIIILMGILEILVSVWLLKTFFSRPTPNVYLVFPIRTPIPSTTPTQISSPTPIP